LPSESAYAVGADAISLSGRDLTEFMSAVIERRKPFRFMARGYSMYPFIKDGDVLTVAPLKRPPHRGDVVAFRFAATQGLVVHRVVASGSGGYAIRGDNSEEPDGVVAPGDVVGVVERVERDGKQVQLGRGVERHLIAALSERGWLVPLVAIARRLRQGCR
jgi:signal peptidase I